MASRRCTTLSVGPGPAVLLRKRSSAPVFTHPTQPGQNYHNREIHEHRSGRRELYYGLLRPSPNFGLTTASRPCSIASTIHARSSPVRACAPPSIRTKTVRIWERPIISAANAINGSGWGRSPRPEHIRELPCHSLARRSQFDSWSVRTPPTIQQMRGHLENGNIVGVGGNHAELQLPCVLWKNGDQANGERSAATIVGSRAVGRQ